MAPIAHSPLESFLLFQTLQPYDGEPYRPAFDRASDSLKSNRLLEQSGAIDQDRLKPESLQDLYLGLVKEQAKLEAASRHGSPAKDANPRKRKLSSPPMDTLEEAARYTHLLPHLLDRLYTQFKEDTVRAIQEEEGEFRKLQSLQHHTDEARAARPGSQGVPPISALLRETEDSAQPRHPAPVEPIINGMGQHETHAPPPEQRSIHADIYQQPARSQPGSAENGPPYLPPPQPPAQPYPLPSSAVDRRGSTQNQGLAASPRLNQAPLPPADRSSASPIILPPPKGMVRSSPPVPSPQQAHYPPPRQPPPQTTPARHPQRAYGGYYDSQGYHASYPPYTQSPVPPIYHQYQMSTHAGHAPPYGGQPYQPPVPTQQAAYYGQYHPPMQPYAQPASQYPDPRTPLPSSHVHARAQRPSPIRTSVTITKWKKPDSSEAANQPGSPIRPQSRDISPISDVDLAAEPDKASPPKTGGRARRSNRAQPQDSPVPDQKSARPRGGRGRGQGVRGRAGRAGSVGSSTMAGSSRRSHSLTEEPAVVKPEPSAAHDETVSVTSPNTADESSRKPPRRRRETLRGPDVEGHRPTTKRKRDDVSPDATPRGKPTSAESPAPTPITPRRAARKPGFILATRNFSRITHNLMNDITAHRLANIFAKPVSDKDAADYKDLILRPQDLKSIKSAISAGGRALVAHLDDLGDGAPAAGAHVWVRESDEMMPPRGIVNAGQLEKEIMRMLANAVMYNQDIPENTGFGAAFRHPSRRMREESAGQHRQPPPPPGPGVGGGSGSGGGGADAAARFEIGVAAPMGGEIVTDTREFAKDAQAVFAEWREVERERDDDVVSLGGGAVGPTGPEDVGAGQEAEEDVTQTVEEDEEGERRSKRRRR